MAKGRKHGSSDRHDILLGTYNYCNGHVVSTDQHDLDEDDVWLTSSPNHAGNEPWTRSGPNRVKHERTGNWTVRNDHRQPGGFSLAFENRYAPGPTVIHHHYRNGAAASAPVSVPSWSNMVPVDSSSPMNRENPPEWVEGVGRTLKGRDMSRVRDAVWSKTGFFG